METLYTEEQIGERISQIASDINGDYGDKPLHVICILKGSVIFFAELVKQLKMPVTMDFMQVSSYEDSTEGGQLRIHKELDEDIDGLDCMVVEDIVDTGNTLDMIKRMLSARSASNVKICTLLDKPSRREVEVQADYIGFEVPDKFVVGYGLDYNQKYRNLPYLAALDESEI